MSGRRSGTQGCGRLPGTGTGTGTGTGPGPGPGKAEALARQFECDPVRSLSVGKGSIALRGLLEFFDLLPRAHQTGGL